MTRRVSLLCNFTSHALISSIQNKARTLEINIDFCEREFDQTIQSLSSGKAKEEYLILLNVPDLLRDFFLDFNQITDFVAVKAARETFRNYLDQIASVVNNRDLQVVIASPLVIHNKTLPFKTGDNFYKVIREGFQSAFFDFVLANEELGGMEFLFLSNEFDILQRREAFSQLQHSLFGNPLSSRHTSILATEIVDFYASKKAINFPKMIILDADNTLWGGVIGEDDADSINIDLNVPGVFFFTFQKQLKFLASKGIMLGLCSKNNMSDLIGFFSSRPDMPLTINDFHYVKSGWESKSIMISSILKESNILADSVVFIDDSNVEIAEVSKFLPEVRCWGIPKNIEDIPFLLSDVVSLNFNYSTVEDLDRARLVSQENSRRLKFDSVSKDDYLKSLGLHLKVTELKSSSGMQFNRIHQLVNKTNQFNLTTERLDLDQLRTFLETGRRIFYGTLTDSYGDYGIIAVCLIDNDSESNLLVSNYLVSCRALGRGIEDSFLHHVREILRLDKSVNSLALRVIPSEKNAPAVIFFNSLSDSDEKTVKEAGRLYVIDLWNSNNLRSNPWVEISIEN